MRILWEKSPLSVREVMELLNRRRPRAYTSVMSLLNVMTDKGLLAREPDGRAFVYGPRGSQKNDASAARRPARPGFRRVR